MSIGAPPPARGVAARMSSTAITLAWLVRLRWHAVAGQALAVLIATRWLGLDLPVAALAALVAITASSNVLLVAWLRREPTIQSWIIGGVLALDTLTLTGLLAFAGGPANPFGVLYLVQVTLAALVLGLGWTAGIVALSAAGYASLYVAHAPLRGPGAHAYHLHGMSVALLITALIVGYFVSRLARALREQQAALARAQRLAARAEKLASLGALAAGAAHELGTPLGTIAVASSELEELITEAPDEAREDARLIREEVERCRGIVQRMSARAGRLLGELPELTTAAAILGLVRGQLGAAELARIEIAIARDAPFRCPVQGLVQVLVSLVQNGLQASEGSAHAVTISAEVAPTRVRFTVQDRGCGIPSAFLPRLGEPFFTTKPPGRGMGLGLFLGRTFAELCSGRLDVVSEEGAGTRATLELPRQVMHAP
ncbi:ATP-binding protein [Sorangium sp. So ce693]|uniref:ATP-binding protein n=1 Tax=Sorangium sp. So ce693 TaxID=3133318 RepID=UPI003F637F6A